MLTSDDRVIAVLNNMTWTARQPSPGWRINKALDIFGSMGGSLAQDVLIIGLKNAIPYHTAPI